MRRWFTLPVRLAAWPFGFACGCGLVLLTDHCFEKLRNVVGGPPWAGSVRWHVVRVWLPEFLRQWLPEFR